MNKEIMLNWFAENETELNLQMSEIEHGYNGVEENPYHKEGSILNHTKMVLDKVDEFFPQDLELLLIALLHDIGKTKTFEDNHEKKRRSFRNHEAVSFFMAKSILDKFEESTNSIIDKRLVLEVIAKHGSLYGYMEDGIIKEKFKEKISEMFKYDLYTFTYLKNFYYCDHLGRICDDTKNITQTIKSFESIQRIIGEDLTKSNTQILPPNSLTLMIGLPRSGKSTYTEKHFQNSIVISRDYFIETMGRGNTYSEKFKSLSKDEQKEIDVLLMRSFQDAVKSGSDVVVDMTSMSKKSRRKFLSDAKVKKFWKRAVIIPTSIETCVSRNTTEKFIPSFVFESMSKNFSFPFYNEFDEIRLITWD